CACIYSWTGINPEGQLTAGAAETELVPGHPGVVFQRSKVWAIDDGDFSVRLGRSAAVATPRRIYRSAPGYPLKPPQYAGRLALMVAVKGLRSGLSRSEVMDSVRGFLSQLEKYLTVNGPVRLADAVTESDLDDVAAGLEHFKALSAQWQEVVAAIEQI